MRTLLCSLASAALGAGAALALAAPERSAPRSTEAILRSYVEDFQADGAARAKRELGVRVTGEGGGEWTVYVAGAKYDDGRWIVELLEGLPEEPTFVYTVDAGTLARIDAGELNALTAQGKAFPDDPAPMDVEWMEGAEETDVNPFSFHFWTRGFPEKVPYGRDLSRVVHSAPITVFYYQEGFRSAWVSLAKGEGANNGPGQPIVAPFPAMVVVTSGRARGTVGGVETLAAKGEMVFIPAMTPHQWWNEEDEHAEVVLLMFGEGA